MDPWPNGFILLGPTQLGKGPRQYSMARNFIGNHDSKN